MESTPALRTDFYQLTMAVGYLHRQMAHQTVVCEAFVRRLPKHRGFLLVAGLERIVEFVRTLRFTRAQVDYLKAHPSLARALDPETEAALLDFAFEGDLWAMPEGTVAFANEPLLRVQAPLWQAQMVETSLLSMLNHSTMVASKAARIVAAAGGSAVMEFGTRRTHDEAAIDAARSAYIAGCVGTSNVEAGFRHGIPVFGTAAHMWTMSHASEDEAFDSYLSVYPQESTLLVDTYDTLEGTRRACQAARRAGDPAFLGGVRVDCGLLTGDDQPTGICKKMRAVLDEEGFSHTRIIVSGDMNEYRMGRLLDAGEPIDAFGVGTKLVASPDAPSLSGVYKIVQVGLGAEARPVLKLSPGKLSYPGAHQVYRRHDASGKIACDRLALADEQVREGAAMLQPIVQKGEPVAHEPDDLEAIRRRANQQMASLPDGALLAEEAVITVEPSEALSTLTEQTAARFSSPT